MKYEHEARLSTPGQQVGKRAGLGYGGLENRPLGKEPTSWICPCCTIPWVKKGARKCMGCGKKTDPIDTATNLATLEMAGTHWQLTVDDQGNAVWTEARSAGAEGPDTDRARDLKLSASVDVSELATDPMACENPDQASFSDFVPSSVRAVIRNCPMELDEEFLTAPMGERPPPLPRRRPRRQTRWQRWSDPRRSSTNFKGGPSTEEAMGAYSSRTWTWTSSARSCWISWVRTGGDPHRAPPGPDHCGGGEGKAPGQTSEGRPRDQNARAHHASFQCVAQRGPSRH